jgi:hypothetical protein
MQHVLQKRKEGRKERMKEGSKERASKQKDCRMFRKELDKFCSKVCPIIHAIFSR